MNENDLQKLRNLQQLSVRLTIAIIMTAIDMIEHQKYEHMQIEFIIIASN